MLKKVVIRYLLHKLTGGSAPSPTSGTPTAVPPPKKRSWRFWAMLVLVALTLCLVAGLLSYKEIPASPEHSETANEVVTGHSPIGTWISGIILVVSLIAIFAWVRHEHQGKWGAMVRDKASIALVSIIIINVLLYVYALEFWSWFYDLGVLYFWGTNISILLCIIFFLKNGWLPKLAAIIFALIILSGLRDEWVKIHPFRKTPRYVQSNDVRATLNVLADAETGDGTPGSARQFYAGTKTPVRNPIDAGPGKGAVCALQINLSDPNVNALVTSNDLDVENSEADCFRAGELLFAERGLGPWEASRKRWEKRIKIVEPTILDLIDVPKDKWSVPVNNPEWGNTIVWWSRIDQSIGDGCQVMFYRGTSREMIVPIKGNYDHLLMQDIQFRCPESGVKVLVKILPKPR